jgi:predicted phage terminase large subunit-like protein
MDALKYVDDPAFYAVFFRRTTKQLERSLWPEAKAMYMPFLIDKNGKFKGKARIQEQAYRITFPTGAILEFTYMERDKDAELNFQGAQVSAVYWDEFTHFSLFQFNYLRTRLRSGAKTPSFMRCSMNPLPDHFVVEYIEPWITESGIADRELSGKIRYFVYVNGNLITSWDKEALLKEYPKKKPRSYTFVPSLLTDNPKMLENNPDYEDNLDSNTRTERETLLNGNWKVRPEGSNFFSRDWLVKVDKVPLNSLRARAWDKASTEPSEKNRYPDYTACSPLMSKDKDGFYYIEWKVDSDVKDNDSDILGRFRKRVGERDKLIEKQARVDGSDCTVIFAVDPGAAGRVEFVQSAKELMREGFIVKEDPMPNNKNKLTRFYPFASACENGLVRIVESSFPNKATLMAWYAEMEAFDGERSSTHRKDDFPDATASCFNWLTKGKILQPFSMNGLTGSDSRTITHKVMSEAIPDIR